LGVDIASQVPRFIRADEGRMRQVILNLAGNAVKFTASGGVTISVDLAEKAGGEVRVRIKVIDTGIGIPADRIGRLFQSFIQVDSSISRRFGGSGLGLAISRKFITGMGGSIGVESVVGRGSTFWFELPLVVASETECNSDADIKTERVAEARSVIAALGRPLHLLVAEDNAINQLVVKTALVKNGIHCDLVGNGLEAVAAVRRSHYDVILMDVQMPEMDGLEATRVIRKLPGPASRTPIIALTANAFVGDIDKCRAAGMNAHVGKPFRAEALIVAIAEALNGKFSFDAQATRAAPEAENVPAIDWNVIEAFRADSGEEMLHLLIDTYLTDTANKLDRLAKLAGDKSAATEALRLAHSLKSASAMAGAAALSAVAARLEKTLIGGGAAGAENEMERMQTLFAVYRANLVDRGLARC